MIDPRPSLIEFGEDLMTRPQRPWERDTWLLIHKHIDLVEEFRHRARTGNGAASASQALRDRVRKAEEVNGILREENSRLTSPVQVYARVIHELRTERMVADIRSPL